MINKIKNVHTNLVNIIDGENSILFFFLSYLICTLIPTYIPGIILLNISFFYILFVVKRNDLIFTQIMFAIPLVGTHMDGVNSYYSTNYELMYTFFITAIIPVALQTIIALFMNVKKPKFGPLFLPLLLVVISVILSYTNAILPSRVIVGLATYSILLLVYFILTNLDKNNEELKENFISTMFYFTLIIVIQYIQFFIVNFDNLVYLVETKHLDIPWAITNMSAFYLTFSLPFIILKGIQTEGKLSLAYYAYSFIIAALSASLLSRAGFVGLAIVMPSMLYLVYRESEDKKLILRFTVGIFVLGIISLIIVLNTDFGKTSLDRLVTNMFRFEDRINLWKAGFQAFLEHPILGQGFFNSRAFASNEAYHNFIIEFLAGTGIVGFTFFSWFLVNLFSPIFKNRSLFGFASIIVVINTLFNFLISVEYYNLITLIPLIYISQLNRQEMK